METINLEMKWSNFILFKQNVEARPKRKRIIKATPVFNLRRYNQLKEELGK